MPYRLTAVTVMQWFVTVLVVLTVGGGGAAEGWMDGRMDGEIPLQQ